jgi:hypothetical protein
LNRQCGALRKLAGNLKKGPASFSLIGALTVEGQQSSCSTFWIIEGSRDDGHEEKGMSKTEEKNGRVKVHKLQPNVRTPSVYGLAIG